MSTWGSSSSVSIMHRRMLSAAFSREATQDNLLREKVPLFLSFTEYIDVILVYIGDRLLEWVNMSRFQTETTLC